MNLSGKHYNLVHINAMYDLINKVYIDVEMQGKNGIGIKTNGEMIDEGRMLNL